MTTKVVARFDKSNIPDVIEAISRADLIQIGGEVSIMDIALACFHAGAQYVTQQALEASARILSTQVMKRHLADSIENTFGVKLIPVTSAYFSRRGPVQDVAEAVKYITWGAGKSCAGWAIYQPGNPEHELIWKVYHSRRAALHNGHITTEATHHAEMIDAGLSKKLSSDASGGLSPILEGRLREIAGGPSPDALPSGEVAQ